MLLCTENLKSFRAREQNMFEWRQEPCQFRDITDNVSLPKVTRNQTKPLSLNRKQTRKNRRASELNENGSKPRKPELNPWSSNFVTPYSFAYTVALSFPQKRFKVGRKLLLGFR